jgi:biotin carboxyl carrier protein
MRYYFLNQDMEELVFDVEASNMSNGQRTMEFIHSGKKTSLFLRKLAGKIYFSFDQQAWRKLPALGVNEVLVSNTQTYKVFRGYKPSGLQAGGAGALITHMPGKIVKIFKQEGDRVSKGETVLILEAMKMENEIKAGAEGIIKVVYVKEGQTLDAGHLMVEITEE